MVVDGDGDGEATEGGDAELPVALVDMNNDRPGGDAVRHGVVQGGEGLENAGSRVATFQRLAGGRVVDGVREGELRGPGSRGRGEGGVRELLVVGAVGGGGPGKGGVGADEGGDGAPPGFGAGGQMDDEARPRRGAEGGGRRGGRLVART